MKIKKENKFHQQGWRTLGFALMLVGLRLMTRTFAELTGSREILLVFVNIIEPGLLMLTKVMIFIGGINFIIGLFRNESLLDALISFLKAEFESPDRKKTRAEQETAFSMHVNDRQILKQQPEAAPLPPADAGSVADETTGATPVPAYHWSRDLQDDLAGWQRTKEKENQPERRGFVANSATF